MVLQIPFFLTILLYVYRYNAGVSIGDMETAR